MSEAMTASKATPLYGVLLVALAALTFAFADTLTKYLTMRHPVPVVVALRYLVNLVLLAVIMGPRLRAGLWRTQRTSLVVLRGLCLAVASLTMGYALRLMPVGETVAIIYLAPIAVMVLAVLLLGEKVSVVGWMAAAAGFLGVLLIARPGAGLDPVGVGLALLNAGLAAAYHLLTRVLSRTETTISMLFHAALVGSVLFSALAVPELDGLSLTATGVGLMALLGALQTVGHLLLTAAYREAPASLLAPVTYLHLVWAGGLGWLVFGHLPDGFSILGMALVSGAGIVVALLSHAAQRGAKAGERAPPVVLEQEGA